MAKKHIKMAICYDFDGTLSPGNMQEHDFIPNLNLKSKDFWDEVKRRSKESEADNILVYMAVMLEKAYANPDVQVSKKAITAYGKKIKLFPGVAKYFDRVNHFARERQVALQHFIISSGLREMIQGSPIAKYFEKIYASSFIYDQHEVARWPGLAINYTTKTQFLFRINKGVLDVWDNDTINDYIPMQDRPIPFGRMIYIGDGSTDVPCMKLVKAHGGHSIAVYKPGSSKGRLVAAKLLQENRVNFIASADYQINKALDKQVKAIITKVASDAEVERLENQCNP